MAIQSGIGVGEAQIYDTSGSMNTYARLMQRQQAQRQAEQKALQEQLAKVKTDGLRDKDKTIFLEKYEKAKDLFRQSLSAKGRTKMELQAQMDQELLAADDIGNRSREYKKLHSDISNKFLDDKFRDQFTDDAVKQWQDTDNYDINDERLIKDPSTLARQVNTAEIDDRLTKIDKGLLSTAVWKNPVTEKATRGNRTGVYESSNREVAPEKQYQAYLNEYDSNRNFRKHLNDKYGDQPKEVLVKAYADERRASGLLSESTEKKFQADSERGLPTYSDLHGSYRDRHPKEDDEATPSSYDVSVKTYRTDSGKINEKSTVHNFVAVSGNKSFAPTQLQNVYNLNNGKNESFSPSGDKLTITGVGEIVAKGGVRQRRVTVVDKDGQEYAFREQDIPVEIRASKGYKASIEASQRGAKGSTTNSSSSQTNSVPSGGGQTMKLKDAKGNVIEAVVKNGKWYNSKTGKAIE